MSVTSQPNSLFQLVDPNSVKPHPLYLSIYGELEDVSDVMRLIQNSQYPRPLLITMENTIVNGHPYWKAALLLGWNQIPVEIRDFPDREAELEALLLENADRKKTTEQKVREAIAWEGIEKVKAKRRQKMAAATTNQKLGRRVETTLVENFPASSSGQTRDKVAKLVGLGSGRNYSKAKKVVTAIDKLRQQGNDKSALDLRKALNEQSVDAATKLIKAHPSQSAKQTDDQERSCWNCQFCSKEQVKDNHTFYCYKFGLLSFLEKDAQTRGEECLAWRYRWSDSDSCQSLPKNSYFTLTLPSHLQIMFEDAARASGMTLVDWTCHHLLQAAQSSKIPLEV
ncbi:hypothetical protein H6G33_30980 [Calothrix sp. FACHB-1219]|uniref:ParB N-terminal domain-containing protein n=1 Tax=unclassified Calothrix TaxID=2619626 RepID=UPI001688D6C5|nr:MULTISPECIES: ParB N-terminal domain-containing protein [unclassified Calothrix]MBD2206603.1 hypothetical protein [Calothrix sp. FACHB-168]MBD2221398.1 hypothetical protein [Calothrix sp. FACHB-1219]